MDIAFTGYPHHTIPVSYGFLLKIFLERKAKEKLKNGVTRRVDI